MLIPRLALGQPGRALAVAIGLIVLACASPPSSAAPPVGGAGQRAESGDLVCESYCSPVTPGTPVVEIRLVVPGAAPAPKMRALAADQQVEASVYEDGFERGLFVRLPAVDPRARFVAPAGAAAPPRPIPGLERLVVSAVATSTEPPGSLRLAQPGAVSDDPGGVVLQVQGLQPGMNYYWRARPKPAADPQVVLCRAPICPMDQRRAPPRPGP